MSRDKDFQFLSTAEMIERYEVKCRQFDTLNHATHQLAHNDQLDISLTARYIALKALEEIK